MSSRNCTPNSHCFLFFSENDEPRDDDDNDTNNDDNYIVAEGEDKDEEDDNNEDKDMPPKARAAAGRGAASPAHASPARRIANPPCTPPHTPPLAFAIEQVAAAVGHATVNDVPAVIMYNFTACYPHIFTETPTLSNGHQTVIGVYLVPTQHFSSYFAHVTLDGMSAIFWMQTPNIFADVYSCTVSELDPHELDFAAILSAMRQTTTIIALEHENFSNIIPTGQIDPLLFPCL